MSERGSFVTEYIYCSNCLETAKKALLHNDKYCCSQQIVSWEGEGRMLPIIAGKLGGLYAGEEIHTLKQLLQQVDTPCHDIRIVVVPEAARAHELVWGPASRM